MKAGELLKIAWMISDAEARNLGAPEILPIHFLLAVMKIIDPVFPERLDRLKLASEDWASMCKEAQSVRRYIDITPELVADRRRALRARLMADRSDSPQKSDVVLHRSESLKRAFSDAAMLVQGDTLHLKDVVESLFELELVSLDDIANG